MNGLKILALGLFISGCSSTPDVPQGYDHLAPVRQEDRVAAAAEELTPKGPPQTCGVAFDLSRGGWFVAKGWGKPVGEIQSFKLYISLHQGGPYCPIEKEITEERLIVRGLVEDEIYYLVMTGKSKAGVETKASPEWSTAAVRREVYLPDSVPRYPE